MAGTELSADTLAGYDLDPQSAPYASYSSRLSWPPVSTDHSNTSRTAPRPALNSNTKRSTSPAHGLGSEYQQRIDHQTQALIPDWNLPQPLGSQFGYPLETTFSQQHFPDDYSLPFQTSPTDFVSTNSHLASRFPQMDGSYLPLNQMDGLNYAWQEIPNDVVGFSPPNALPDMSMPHQTAPANSPSSNSYLEVRSLSGSGSDNGWNTVDYVHQSFDSSSFQDPQAGAIFNPGQALHGRTFSDSSYSDIERQSPNSWSSGFVEVPNAIGSPGTDSFEDMDFNPDPGNYMGHAYQQDEERERPSRPVVVTSVKPINIKKPSSPQRSPVSSGRGSPPSRRPSRKNTNIKATKPAIRRPSQAPKPETEKRVGRRKGPLRPEQRKQACEIRKLGACLRCKFLKKTCDPGEPCSGCQPSHARLWCVPCTRIDIKEIAYFMKDWRADYERHVSLGFSIGNIKGFGDAERTLFITHGYGHMLPIRAREVFVRDERCFGLDWVETPQNMPEEHSVNTAKLSAGENGVSTVLLSDYLDRHIDGGFENFVDEYFEGTPFLTQMLKTAYRFWLKERTPIIRKALKLLLAYNLTQHVTMVEGIPDEEGFLGKITDDNSKFKGKTVAPVMINFQIKCAMADKWRELQKEILEELSHLYSSVYTRDKLKHWPTIFMVASVLLGVWEEMQFDCHYRIPDKEIVNKFCNDMESTPVGVIVGLFSAISQKLPSFLEWETSKHHQALQSNPSVCEAMTEVRGHVTANEAYLKGRSSATFDRNDFDSLSSKFVSKLVIRAN